MSKHNFFARSYYNERSCSEHRESAGHYISGDQFIMRRIIGA